MDLVDEQDVVGLEVGEDGGEVAGLGQHRAAGGAEVDAQFAGDDLGQRGLAQTRRAEQQHVVQRLAARLGALDEHPQVPLGLLLPDELGEGLRAQRLVGGFQRRGFSGDEAGHRPSSCNAALIKAGASASSPMRSAACSTTRLAAGSATPRPIRAATASPAADGGAGLAGPADAWKAATRPSAMGLSFSSVTMRSASFGPTPWARETAAWSPRPAAACSSAGGRTSRTASAALGPTP